MKDKHTPAPWRATENGSIEHEGGILGEAYDFDSGYLGLKAESLPMIANARLMAAAPEMFDALRDLYNASVLQGMAFDMAWQKAITLYEELITKIEGDE